MPARKKETKADEASPPSPDDSAANQTAQEGTQSNALTPSHLPSLVPMDAIMANLVRANPTFPDENRPLDERSGETGLQLRQEYAAVFLLAGLNVAQTAQAIGVHRSTIWEWQKLAPFRMYINRLKSEAKKQVEVGLFALHEAALGALYRAMTSDNEAVALKAATYVIEHVQSASVGHTSMQSLILSRLRSREIDALLAQTTKEPTREEYEEACREEGIDP